MAQASIRLPYIYQLCGELSGMGETQYSHVRCTVNKTKSSLRKQTSFHNASTGFPAKSHLRNGWRDSILLTCYSPDLGSASDWLLHKICFMQIYPDLGSTSDWLCLEICLNKSEALPRSAVIPQMSFHGETNGGAKKWLLFSEARKSREDGLQCRLDDLGWLNTWY